MAELILLPNPQLQINIIDDNIAELTLTQRYKWDTDLASLNATAYYLGIYMMGDDGGFRGADDALGVFSSDYLPTPGGVDEYSLTITNRVQREILNEDVGRGAIARARRRRDEDEIYVNVLLFGYVRSNVWDRFRGWERRWLPQGNREKSNIVTGMRF